MSGGPKLGAGQQMVTMWYVHDGGWTLGSASRGTATLAAETKMTVPHFDHQVSDPLSAHQHVKHQYLHHPPSSGLSRSFLCIVGMHRVVGDAVAARVAFLITAVFATPTSSASILRKPQTSRSCHCCLYRATSCTSGNSHHLALANLIPIMTHPTVLGVAASPVRTQLSGHMELMAYASCL
jgi:hypothetical protein